jgi:hypothetical protein
LSQLDSLEESDVVVEIFNLKSERRLIAGKTRDRVDESRVMGDEVEADDTSSKG